MSTLLLRNGHVVFPWGVLDLDILIEDGVVKSIGRNIEYRADQVIDVSGKIVLPGAIDVHVHMRDPGLEYKDNFQNGTRDAAQGGVTTVLEMPNTVPPVDTRTRFLEKRRLLESKAYVDFGLYGVLHDNNVDEFEEIVKAGAVGFKVFLGPTTGNIPSPSTHTLYEILAKSGKYDVPIAFHAEEWELVDYFTKRELSSGSSDLLVHVRSRPPICEELAIYRVGLLARETKANIHIVHMSSCEALEAVKSLKRMGVNVSSETNPHYLLLGLEDYKKYGSIIKVNPPIRGGKHRECLWKGLRSGDIEIIASDHAPHSVEEKMKNMVEAASGFPGVYTLLPLMVDKALRGELSLSRVVEVLSMNPAKKFRLYPRKGCLNPGCDGDLVVIDPGREWVVDKEKMFCKNKITPFHSWRLKGVIEYTILRGNVIYEDGELIDKSIGIFVKPIK